MINKGKLYSYQNARFFKQTSQLKTKKLMMYSPGDPFIMVAPVVTSWAVAGQRMVFLHMYLQTRVTLEAFPVATPRGRSSSSHEGEREIRIMDVQPPNLQQLRDAIMSIWTKISEECFQILVESMPWRIKAVMKAKGVPTW